MTLRMMQDFGILYKWHDSHTISIPAQAYQGRKYHIEADWSAASYLYAMAALVPEVDLYIDGLSKQGLQGDAAIAEMMQSFGIVTKYTNTGIHLSKEAGSDSPMREYDFVKTPDLAQTLSVLCAAQGKHGLFSGLQTLKIKETDRVAALKKELSKVGVSLMAMPARFSPKSGKAYYMQEGQAQWDDTVQFDTYQDHRMAMALAPLALLGNVEINDPQVVSKSYPKFWEDLALLGFEITNTINDKPLLDY